MTRILISAGEVSGDLLGAQVANEMRTRLSDCSLFGLGGSRMAAAGVEIVSPTSQLGASGFTEAVAVATRLFACWRRVRARVDRTPPDVALLIGNDVFHTWMSRKLRKLGVRTVVCYPPLVWVWSWVSGFIGRSFDTVLTSFPEEDRVYRAAGADAVFVGHFLVDKLRPVTPEERAAARAELGIAHASRVVTLLPGSRVHEIALVGPPLVDAAAQLAARDPDLTILLPVADDWLHAYVRRAVQRSGGAGLVRLTTDSHTSMRAADLLLVASGTATLEGMLLQVPMVIGYRLSTLSATVIRALIRMGFITTDLVGLPNIILRRVAIPELVQERFTGANIASEGWAVLTEPGRQAAQRRAFAEAGAQLGRRNTVTRIADVLLASSRHLPDGV